MRILVADDDPNVLEPLEIALRRAGYTVIPATNGRRAWELFKEEHPDFAVLDVTMPGLDGLEVARRIARSGPPRVPVIMLTGRDRVDDKVSALEDGADDYVVKPITHRELVARIRAVLRRANPTAQAITAGRLTINPATHQFSIDGSPIDVTGIEFALLLILMEHAGQVVPPDAIMERLWGHDVSDDLLRVTVYRLRRKIEPNPSQPITVLTVPGVGFMVNNEARPE